MKLEYNPKTRKYEKFKDPTKLVDEAIRQGAIEKAPADWLYHMKLKVLKQSQVFTEKETGMRSVYASGTGMLYKHDTKGIPGTAIKERKYPAKEVPFEVEFKEVKDDIGQPDIKITKFTCPGL
jgi:hypothetical protein